MINKLKASAVVVAAIVLVPVVIVAAIRWWSFVFSFLEGGSQWLR